MQDNETSKPWYKYLWVWLIMLPPLASVIGGIVTLILAGGPPEMVDDDVNASPAVIQSELEDAAGTDREFR